jgi:rubrerythrin
MELAPCCCVLFVLITAGLFALWQEIAEYAGWVVRTSCPACGFRWRHPRRSPPARCPHCGSDRAAAGPS